MKKNALVVAAVLFSALLLVPTALANVYVPPGPKGDRSSWICPYLGAFDVTQDYQPVGWHYSDGCMYDPIFQTTLPHIYYDEPCVPYCNMQTVPFGDEVMILGFIPNVYASTDQPLPSIELSMKWNGIPYLVTLTTSYTEGLTYPPAIPDDQAITYPFAYPAQDPYKTAYYNIWCGDIYYVLQHFDITCLDPSWFESFYGMVNGYWFWYRFHPNVGDWIAYNCEGQTKFPPTYDITALFESGTSQIWFNHVCFDTTLLQVHKTVDWNYAQDTWYGDSYWPIAGPVTDEVQIENHGSVRATGLDFQQTFPSLAKYGVKPDYSSAEAMIYNSDNPNMPPRVGWTTLTGFGDTSNTPYYFQGGLSYLDPDETMVITIQATVYNMPELTPPYYWSGTIVFDCMVSADQIIAWKEPIGLYGLGVGSPSDYVTYLWYGWKLMWNDGGWEFRFVDEGQWPVYGDILRNQLTHPAPTMTLDPVPVDLNGDGKINAQDVALVRQAVVGLIAYNMKMDINGNSKIDTGDLAAYKLAAKG